MDERRETVGALSVEALLKTPETLDPREQGNEMTKPYMGELFKTLEDGKKNIAGNFFITVLTKRERLLTNVIRNYFFYRHSCPTPDYDQAVYYYDNTDDELELLWVIPSQQMAHELKEHALTLDKEYSELLQFVLDFADGTLFKKAQLLNKEDKKEGRVVLKEIHE